MKTTFKILLSLSIVFNAYSLFKTHEFKVTNGTSDFVKVTLHWENATSSFVNLNSGDSYTFKAYSCAHSIAFIIKNQTVTQDFPEHISCRGHITLNNDRTVSFNPL